jgi:hypothetical protein
VTCCPIVELRQYTLHPGKRDDLIDLFDREFVEPQETLGMRIIGQFRDLDDSNRFVWLRGFEDMPSRRDGLAAFYGGPVWRAHRDAANATMVDSNNVLLLTPARPASGFELGGLRRANAAGDDSPSSTIVAVIASLAEPATSEDIDRFERDLVPALTRGGALILASFVTEGSANTFPALPVREGENVFVCFARLSSGTTALPSAVTRELGPNTQILRLAATSRSLLR